MPASSPPPPGSHWMGKHLENLLCPHPRQELGHLPPSENSLTQPSGLRGLSETPSPAGFTGLVHLGPEPVSSPICSLCPPGSLSSVSPEQPRKACPAPLKLSRACDHMSCKAQGTPAAGLPVWSPKATIFLPGHSGPRPPAPSSRRPRELVSPQSQPGPPWDRTGRWDTVDSSDRPSRSGPST